MDVAIARPAGGIPDVLDPQGREIPADGISDIFAVDRAEEIARDGIRPGRDSGVGAGEPHEDGRGLIGVEGVEEVLSCHAG